LGGKPKGINLMRTKIQICAVAVNQNTSQFTELMLRTLFLKNDLQAIDFRITILDNHSDDESLESLNSYLAERKIALLQTGFDTSVAPEKHGTALTQFIKEAKECSYYLFLDSDMWFIETDTIPMMVKELSETASNIFANQAQIFGYYAYRIIEGKDRIAGANDLDGKTWETWLQNPAQNARYETHIGRRCSPVCALVRNIAIFHTVVEKVGLTPAIRFGPREAIHCDTFSLMTNVMATHGYDFMVSSKRVNHFTETGYRSELRAIKDRDCQKMLQEIYAGKGMEQELFWQSDWKKQAHG